MTQLPLWTPNLGDARTNFERTGERDMTPSLWLRATALSGQKDIDLDMVSYNYDITQMQTAFEFTGQTAWEYKGTTGLRLLAERCGSYAVLVGYQWKDINFQHRIAYKVWEPDGRLLERRVGATWSDLERLRQDIRDMYR